MAAFVSRYASAFQDVVISAKLDAKKIDGQLTDFLATWNGSAELRQFFTNPAIAALQKVAFLDTLNAKLKLQKELRNLIAVLINNGRIGQVSEVAAAWRALVQQQSGVKPAEIVTARELGASERVALAAEVAKLAGAQISASYKIDPAILGGTVVRIGSTVYDGSVRGRLERLKETLMAD
jgi:F-type H+-transporting ATPase subunit delta